jgi:hypothetical protein
MGLRSRVCNADEKIKMRLNAMKIVVEVRDEGRDEEVEMKR